MIAVVAGSTGLVGTSLLEQLLKDASFSAVITVGRRASGTSATHIPWDFSPGSPLPELDVFRNDGGVMTSAFFCCLGTTLKKAGSKEEFQKVDQGYVLRFAELALKCNAKHFGIVTAFGANPKSRVFYNRVKGQTEEALRELPWNQLYIYHPSLLLGPRTEKRPAERIMVRLGEQILPFVPSKIGKWIGTEASALARMMILNAKHGKTGSHTIEPSEI
jgi:uncharacterized protein YbjT (DUF2867 family)